MKSIWLISRELEGWAAAGGIKDVVRDQAKAFGQLGWQTQVVLPLYGFLKKRVFTGGQLVWQGHSPHPLFQAPFEVWSLQEEFFTVYFLRSPAFEAKDGVYTYTAEEERRNPRHIRGEGYLDTYRMNLEFQWGIAAFWQAAEITPAYVLGNDGHTGFLPAILKTTPEYQSIFSQTIFALLIHNAGPFYRQEMPADAPSEALLNLPPSIIQQCLLDHYIDPLVCAALTAKIATVSENYAVELLTGRNDHWSGSFGRWLRTHKIPLRGITNGISTEDKDPRFPEKSGLPAAFDPATNTWEGKYLCRLALRETLILRSAFVFGRFSTWDTALYVMQGRLTAQKGVDALFELVERALNEKCRASFIIMAQGEKRYEDRFQRLARERADQGRLIFVNKFEDQTARLVFAAGDFFLMPSEYEPCGLTDLKAQLMGTLPIVHQVGGLVKVHNEVTGFAYEKHHHQGFWGAFLRSLEVYHQHPDQLQSMRARAFTSVFENYNWAKILQESYIPWLTEEASFSILSPTTPT